MSEAVKFEKGIKYEIFIGIKDKDNYQEMFSVADFKQILTEICTEEEISFSLLTQVGGYTHNKGYTTETSLRIVLIGISEEEVHSLGNRLKEIINTDTILITKTDIDYSFVG